MSNHKHQRQTQHHHQIQLEDLDHFNPDWQFAIDHGKSLTPGKKTISTPQANIYNIQLNQYKEKLLETNQNQQHSQLCRCCLNEIQKDPIPLLSNTKQLDVIGFGFPIYFSFLRNCLILLFVMIVTFNAMELYSSIKAVTSICQEAANSQDTSTQTTSDTSSSHLKSFLAFKEQNFLNQNQTLAQNRLLGSTTSSTTTTTQSSTSTASNSSISCYSFMINSASINFQLTQRQLMRRLVTFVAIFFTLLYIRQKQLKLDAYFDQKTTSLGDYSIKINNLPSDQKGIQKTVRQFFLKAFEKPHQIKQITLIPYLEEFFMIKNQKSHLIQEKLKLIKSSQKNQTMQEYTQKLNQMNDQINLKKGQLIDYCKKSKQKAEKDQMLAEKMILVFDTDHQKEQILQQFKKMDKQVLTQYFGQKGKKLVLVQAPQPKEIIWQNFNYPKQKKYIRIVLGWIFTALFIGVVTVVFYFILVQKSKLIQQSLVNYHHNPIKYQTQKKIAVGLVYFSLILIILFNKLLLGLVLSKIALFQTHGTTFSYSFSFTLKYSLCLFFTTAVMTLAVEAFTLNNYYTHEYGVIEQQTIMFFLNAFFVPMFWIVNPWYIINIIKRKCYYGSQNITQESANALMELPHYDMGKRLAQILETMWFTFLYADLIPLGAFLSFIGLALYYWVDKYNLLRRSSINRHVSAKLLKRSLTLLDFVLLYMSLGLLIFDIQITHTYHWSTFVYIGISLSFLFVPWNQILNCIFDQKFDLQEKTFTQVKENFIVNYHTLHPIRRALYLKRFLNDVVNSPTRRKVAKKTTLKSYNFDLNQSIVQNGFERQKQRQTEMSKLKKNLGFPQIKGQKVENFQSQKYVFPVSPQNKPISSDKKQNLLINNSKAFPTKDNLNDSSNPLAYDRQRNNL